MSASLLAPLSGDFGLNAAVTLVLIGAGCGAVGIWVLHFGQAILAESFTHALLPGLVVAAIVGAGPILGALVGVLVAYGLILIAVRAPRTSSQTGISAAISTLVALGGLLAMSGVGVAGFEAMLFGDPLAASRGDVIAAAVLAAVIAVVLAALGGQFAALAFDRGTAVSLGVNVGLVSAAALALLALAVALSANIAGSLLALALVTGPAYGATAVTDRLRSALLLSAFGGALCGLVGLYVSWYAGWPVAPSVALVIALWALGLSSVRAARDQTARLG